MKLEELKYIIKEVIEESNDNLDLDDFYKFKDEYAERNKTSIIDKDEYDQYVSYLKKYILNDKNISRMKANHVPYSTFTDMKGLHKYISPLVGFNKKIVNKDDLIAKQIELNENRSDIDDLKIGNKIYYETTNKKGDSKLEDYIIVNIVGDDVWIKKAVPSTVIRTKANAVAKYEDALAEYNDILNSAPDSEQVSFL